MLRAIPYSNATTGVSAQCVMDTAHALQDIHTMRATIHVRVPMTVLYSATLSLTVKIAVAMLCAKLIVRACPALRGMAMLA